MKLSFELRAVCGPVYTQGNLQFDASCTSLYCAIGNRINCYQLNDGLLCTLPMALRHAITVLAITPNGKFMVAVEGETGYAILINLEKMVVIKYFRLDAGGKILTAAFTPCGQFLVVGGFKMLEIWKLSLVFGDNSGEHGSSEVNDEDASGIEFMPFVLVHRIRGHLSNINSIQFSEAQNDAVQAVSGHGWFILTASDDNTARVFLLDNSKPGCGDGNVSPVKDPYEPPTLRAHKDAILGAYFLSPYQLITVSKEGAIFFWKKQLVVKSRSKGRSQAPEDHPQVHGWLLLGRKYLNLSQYTGKIVTCDFNPATRLLVLGLSSGVFQLISFEKRTETDDSPVTDDSSPFTVLQTMAIFKGAPITACKFDKSGKWISLVTGNMSGNKAGRCTLGLAVYEWQSETFILKQEGSPYNAITCISASTPSTMTSSATSASIYATGDIDGNISIYDGDSYLCFLKLRETGHSGPITSLFFMKGNQVLLSSSVDGTVRAHDLLRYRQSFRVLSTPSPVRLSSVCGDTDGQFVIAAAGDAPFLIYLWELRTGKLLDAFAGHSSPVTSLAFDPLGRYLISGGLDKTVRQWQLFSSSSDGEELGRSRSNAEVIDTMSEVAAISFKPDGREFLVSTLVNITFYNTETQAPIATISPNLDLQGTSRSTTDARLAKNKFQQSYFTCVAYSPDASLLIAAGNSPHICIYDAETKTLLKRLKISDSLLIDGTLAQLNSSKSSDHATNGYQAIPGTKSSMDRRSWFPEMRVSGLAFSLDARSILALTTEGLLVYSLDSTITFDPIELTPAVTPESIFEMVSHDASRAFLLALKLNDEKCLKEVFVRIPRKQISRAIDGIPKGNSTLITRLAILINEALTTNFVRSSTDQPDTGENSSPASPSFFSPIETILEWTKHFFLIHGSAMKRLVKASSSHISRIASLSASGDEVIVPSISTLSMASDMSLASSGKNSALLPALCAIQASLKSIYFPLAKVANENTYRLQAIIDDSKKMSLTESQ